MIRKLLSKLRIPSVKQSKFTHHFIHIPKNGGMAIRSALQNRGGVVLTDEFHFRYVDVINPENQHLQFFCVVRNPWSRTASRFQYAKQRASTWSTEDPRRIYIENASFEDFVKDRIIFDGKFAPSKPWLGPLNSWFNQLLWIKDEKNNVSCDCLRFENLNADLSGYFQEHLELPSHNVTPNAVDYRTLYTSELVDEVTEFFADDIAYFGFDFESSARQNTVFS